MTPLSRSFLALAFLLLLFPSSPAADNKELAKKARVVLEKHCYRCHGENGKAIAGVFVLNRERLVGRKKLEPGNAAKSRLYRSMTEEEMPPPEEKVRPTKEDIDVIRQWIQGGAPDFVAAPPPRTFVSNSAILDSIEGSLRKVKPRDRKFRRYFTLTHLYNAGVSDDELEQYRHGLSKLLNSLSFGREIVKPKPLSTDKTRTILSIDLRDYEWIEATWQAILKRNPYGVRGGQTTSQFIENATGTDLPYVRADWFVFAASRPPLYHDVLGIPLTDAALEKRLEVDVQGNIKRDRVARSGFNGSGVSRNNRLLERHRSTYGAYWKSYDFASNDGRKNLFNHPLGPLGRNAFEADGGEIIFSLPNGLQGYMLTDGKGKRIDEGPIKVVSTGDRRKPEVINGVSCMSCHSRGMIFKDDQVRKAVQGSNAFPGPVKKTVLALYPQKETFDKLLKEDAERFQKAVEKTGDSVQKTDTVVLLTERFEEEIDLKHAAAELGLVAEEFRKGLIRIPKLGRPLAPLRVGGTVKRDTFVETFAAAVAELGLGKVR